MQAVKVCISCFRQIRFAAFKRQRYWIASLFAARRPCGLVGGEKSSSLRSGIFLRQALRKKAIQRSGAYKIGKTYPDGIFHSLKAISYETTSH